MEDTKICLQPQYLISVFPNTTFSFELLKNIVRKEVIEAL